MYEESYFVLKLPIKLSNYSVLIIVKTQRGYKKSRSSLTSLNAFSENHWETRTREYGQDQLLALNSVQSFRNWFPSCITMYDRIHCGEPVLAIPRGLAILQSLKIY